MVSQVAMATRADELKPTIIPVILSLVAGAGHLLIGRSRRGLLLFVTALCGWNLALLQKLHPIPPLKHWMFTLGLTIGISITAFAIFDMLRLAVYARLPRVRRHRRLLLKQAIGFYLRHEFHEARSFLDQMLDVDPADPVARLYLASLERRAGRYERAIHHARRALAAHPHNRFHPELEREIALAREARRHGP